MSAGERKRPKVDPHFEGEPHSLPLTQAWKLDYWNWVAEGCPSREEQEARRAAGASPGMPFDVWLEKNPAPDLQELVERAGRRYCVSIGEEYVEDPFKRPPHQGGYQHITLEEWAEYDRALVAWQRRRRAGL